MRVVIPYAPRKVFKPFHARKQRFSAIVAHRRTGKTVMAVNDLIKKTLTCTLPNPRTAYIAPLLKQAKAVAWDYAKHYARAVPHTKINESELRIDFLNGGRFQLYGADNIDSLRGIYLDDVVLDEYGDMNPYIFHQVLRPALADRAGRATFLGTPKGKNDFYRVCEHAKKDPNWLSLELKASQTGLLSQDELDSMRSEMDEDLYLQEMECVFDSPLKGAFYGKEMKIAESEGRIGDVKYEEGAPVFTAWDLGWTDDTAIWTYQVVYGEIRLIDFYCASGEELQHYVDYLKAKPYDYTTHYLPHDARHKRLEAQGRSIEEQLKNLLGWGAVQIGPQLKAQAGIQAARQMFSKCYFDKENCKVGLDCLRNYRRKWDETRKVFSKNHVHDWASHGADGFRYVAATWQEEFKPAPKEKNPLSDYGSDLDFDPDDWKLS